MHVQCVLPAERASVLLALRSRGLVSCDVMSPVDAHMLSAKLATVNDMYIIVCVALRIRKKLHSGFATASAEDFSILVDHTFSGS